MSPYSCDMPSKNREKKDFLKKLAQLHKKFGKFNAEQ